MKLNPAGQEEIIYVTLSETQHPVAFANKLRELTGCGMTEREARLYIMANPIVLEIYYEPDRGLFAVESESLIDDNGVRSPYSGEFFE